MRRWNLSHYAISSFVTGALLAGCGILPLSLSKGQDDMQPPIGASGALPQTVAKVPARIIAHRKTSSSYQVLFRFGREPGSRSHGRHPIAGLIDVNGTLYGTTDGGGGSDNGTVYSISTAGKETVLHRFLGGSDGAHPQADLVEMNGTLYGTTTLGGGSGCGGNGCGTVFMISTTGAEKVLYRFAPGCPPQCSDGLSPYGSLINVNGTLYGTTAGGGDVQPYYCCGTVYRISTTGKEKVLYRFGTKSPDGFYPYAGLIDVNGMLYGTTYSGGASGPGTVYSISTAGAEKVVYSFSGGSDGEYPYAGLVDVNGTLYGTTSGGGGSGCKANYTYGCGIVYSVSTSGAEKVLYRFGGGFDGANPYAGLTNVNGELYGTTQFGGGGSCPSQSGGSGCGTVYSLTTAGLETVLHSFTGGSDGANPVWAALVDVSGTLYGTTYYGGYRCHELHCGTVFTLTP